MRQEEVQGQCAECRHHGQFKNQMTGVKGGRRPHTKSSWSFLTGSWGGIEIDERQRWPAGKCRRTKVDTAAQPSRARAGVCRSGIDAVLHLGGRRGFSSARCDVRCANRQMLLRRPSG